MPDLTDPNDIQVAISMKATPQQVQDVLNSTGGQVVYSIPEGNGFLIAPAPGSDPVAIVAQLKANPLVLDAGLNINDAGFNDPPPSQDITFISATSPPQGPGANDPAPSQDVTFVPAPQQAASSDLNEVPLAFTEWSGSIHGHPGIQNLEPGVGQHKTSTVRREHLKKRISREGPSHADASSLPVGPSHSRSGPHGHHPGNRG
jgi:hypothetical protein